jgi:hypothetical protein
LRTQAFSQVSSILTKWYPFFTLILEQRMTYHNNNVSQSEFFMNQSNPHRMTHNPMQGSEMLFNPGYAGGSAP